MRNWKCISDKIREASSEIIEGHHFAGTDMPEVSGHLLDAMHSLLWAHTELLAYFDNAPAGGRSSTQPLVEQEDS